MLRWMAVVVGLIGPDLALAGPHAELQAAVTALRAGHIEQALATAEQLTTVPDLHVRASLLAASAEQAAGRPHDALRRLRSLWKDDLPGPDRTEVRWRWARAAALAGHPGRARAIAAPLRRLDDAEYAPAARIARPAWRLSAQGTVAGWQRLGRVLDQQGLDPRAPSSAVSADALRLRVAIAVDRSRRVPLRGNTPAARRRLTRRLAWLEAADKDTAALLRLGHHDPLFDALVTLAEGWRDTADALAHAPPPRRLTTPQADAYRQGLREAAQGPLRRAHDAYEAALRVAERDRVAHDAPRVVHVRASLDAIAARRTLWRAPD